MQKIKDLLTDHLGNLSSKRTIGCGGLIICFLIYLINITIFYYGFIDQLMFKEVDNSVFDMMLFFGGILFGTSLEKIGFKGK